MIQLSVSHQEAHCPWMTSHQEFIRAREPILYNDVKVVRVARLGGGSDPAKVTRTDVFELKRQVRDLFEELEHLHDGTVIRLEFRHGLPFLLETRLKVVPAEELQ